MPTKDRAKMICCRFDGTDLGGIENLSKDESEGVREDVGYSDLIRGSCSFVQHFPFALALFVYP